MTAQGVSATLAGSQRGASGIGTRASETDIGQLQVQCRA